MKRPLSNRNTRESDSDSQCKSPPRVLPSTPIDLGSPIRELLQVAKEIQQSSTSPLKHGGKGGPLLAPSPGKGGFSSPSLDGKEAVDGKEREGESGGKKKDPYCYGGQLVVNYGLSPMVMDYGENGGNNEESAATQVVNGALDGNLQSDIPEEHSVSTVDTGEELSQSLRSGKGEGIESAERNEEDDDCHLQDMIDSAMSGAAANSGADIVSKGFLALQKDGKEADKFMFDKGKGSAGSDDSSSEAEGSNAPEIVRERMEGPAKVVEKPQKNEGSSTNFVTPSSQVGGPMKGDKGLGSVHSLVS